MAPALTSSNPFHLNTTSIRTKDLQRGSNFRSLALPRPIPFIRAKKQDNSSSEDVPTKPKGFFFDFNGKFSEAAKSLVPALVGSSATKGSLLFSNQRKKDPNTVFVAGATGQAGVRIVQNLLRKGFAVRAGVSDLASAQELALLAAKYKVISPEEAKRLNAVESFFEDAEAIARSIGNASKVVVTIGSGEKGPSAEVTTDDALEVIRAADLASVGHVVIVYDASMPGFYGGSSSSTYNVLDGITSFFNNLFSKSQPLTMPEFLSKVVETEVTYTLIKASLTDDVYANDSLGISISKEGSKASATSGTTTTDNYKVSKSQIASLVSGIFANTSVAENKVVEVSAIPSAPSSKPIDELFSSIPEDGRRKAYKEAVAKAKAEEEALAAAEKARKELEGEVQKLPDREAQAANAIGAEARRKVEAAGASLEGLFSKANDFGNDFSWDKLSSQLGIVKKVAEDEPKVQLATVRGQAKARALPAQKAVVKKAKARSQPEKTRPEVRKVFGGLFQQETIYVDD